jgi:hypothetical protein
MSDAMNHATEILQLLAASNERALATAPLISPWHHGNGVLCCGTLRIATLSIDTNPTDEFKAELLDWICQQLNMESRLTEAMRVVVEQLGQVRGKTHDEYLECQYALSRAHAILKEKGD